MSDGLKMKKALLKLRRFAAKGMKSFSAAACTPPKILLAERSVKNPPANGPADFFARSGAPVTIGRLRPGDLIV